MTTQAKIIGYWDNLKEMPKEGPFVLCNGPVGASVPRIEQVRGEDGVGCPIGLDMEMYEYIKTHNIPRGYEGACQLNERYFAGEFEWRGAFLCPKKVSS